MGKAIRRLLPALNFAVILLLGACATNDAQRTVFNIRSAYTIALAAAVEYESLPRCVEGTEQIMLCSDPDIVAEIRTADLAAKATLDNAEAFVRSHPELDAVAAIDAAASALDAFNSVLALYGIEQKGGA